MGVVCTNSVLTLSVTYKKSEKGEQDMKLDLNGHWTWTQTTASVPEAVWGQPISKTETPAVAAKTLPGRFVGLNTIKPPIHHAQGPDAIPLDNLSYDQINKLDDESYLPFSQSPQTGQPQASETSLQTIASTITKDSDANSPMANRAAILAALNQLGVTPGSNGDLTALSSNINLSYTAPPMLGSPVAG